MKRIFESEYIGADEQAERITVFQIDNSEEYNALSDMKHDEFCELLNVCDESGYNVLPGAMYHTYSFYLSGSFFLMMDVVAYNV